MDKINVALWDQYFGATEQQVLYSSERYTHFAVQFQQPGLASGKINAINTPGMLFTELYVDACRPFSLYDDTPKETAESVFVLDGKVESRFERADTLYFNSHQHNIQYSTDFSGTHIIHSPKFHACTITYHDHYLNSLCETEPCGSLGLFSQHLQKKKRFLGATGGLGWQQRMGELIQAIRQCPFHGVTKYIFTESKLLELFVLQMEQVAVMHDNPAREQWSLSDKEKLFAVKEFISTSYLEPLSLQMITCKFGLNEFKLKKGYKHFFGATVFSDIHKLRMQHAQKLLTERVMNVTEVAYHIGYNDLSSFSYAFKKTFGYSPKGSDVVQFN
jgi:AraC-like DNA-binding protein